jgi:hypothetical protein
MAEPPKKTAVKADRDKQEPTVTQQAKRYLTLVGIFAFSGWLVWLGDEWRISTVCWLSHRGCRRRWSTWPQHSDWGSTRQEEEMQSSAARTNGHQRCHAYARFVNGGLRAISERMALYLRNALLIPSGHQPATP